MSRQFPRLMVLWLGWLVCGPAAPVTAQREETRPPKPSLIRMTRSSGYIFAGTVTGVAPVKAGRANQVPAVEISFHVDRAVRGVRSGQTLRIREWAGLWRAGERYRVGEKMFLFLYRPSKLGLTSPVGGAMGRLRLDAKGQVALAEELVEAVHSDLAARVRGRVRLSSRELATRARRAMEE